VAFRDAYKATATKLAGSSFQRGELEGDYRMIQDGLRAERSTASSVLNRITSEIDSLDRALLGSESVVLGMK
jgi:hypothetical protein